MLPLSNFCVENYVEKCTRLISKEKTQFCRNSTKVRYFFFKSVERSLVLQSVVSNILVCFVIIL